MFCKLSQKSFLDRYHNRNQKSNQVNTQSETFKEERKRLESEAVKYQKARKATKSKVQDVGNKVYKEGYWKGADRQDRIVNEASNTLRDRLQDLCGKGGVSINLDEVRSLKAHKDVIDESNVLDEALISFDVDFTTPRGKKSAKLVVSYKEANDKKSRFAVENSFFDNCENEYELNHENLGKFLTESKVESKVKETPIAYFNYDVETFEVIDAPANTDKVAARLTSKGFKVERRYVDACYDPNHFGKICYVVQVGTDKNKVAAFKKIVSMSDDEWTNRGEEQSFKARNPEFNDRSLETGSYTKKEDWVNRSLEGGKEGNRNYGNPYGNEAKMLASDARKKQASKQNDILKDISELEELCK